MQDTSIVNASGGLASGSCVARWDAYIDTSGKPVAAGERVLSVSNGVLDVELEPASYTITCDFLPAAETWLVPLSATPVVLGRVRVTSGTPGSVDWGRVSNRPIISVPRDHPTITAAYAAGPSSGVRIFLSGDYTISTPEVVQMTAGKKLILDFNGHDIVCTLTAPGRCLAIWQDYYIKGAVRTLLRIGGGGTMRYVGTTPNIIGLSLAGVTMSGETKPGNTEQTMRDINLRYFNTEGSIALYLDGTQESSFEDLSIDHNYIGFGTGPTKFGASSALAFRRVAFQENVHHVYAQDGPGGATFQNCNFQASPNRYPVMFESINTSFANIVFDNSQWESNGDGTSASAAVLLKAAAGTTIGIPVFRGGAINGGPPTWGGLGVALEFQGNGHMIGPLIAEQMTFISLAGGLLRGFYTASGNSPTRVSSGGNDATGLLSNPSEPLKVYGRSTLTSNGNGTEALKLIRNRDTSPTGPLLTVRNAADTRTLASISATGVVEGAGFTTGLGVEGFLRVANSSGPSYINGKLGIGHKDAIISGTGKLHVAGNTARIFDSERTPSTAGETCNTGELAFDASYIYICVAANTWKRSALTSW